jgi:beta-lactamase regulating signal transducer with metallopeptidase domain
MSDLLLVEIALKSSVILLAACVAATWMWSRSSAGARHLTWTVSLVAVLLVPILAAFGPDWNIPVSIGVDAGVDDPLANRSSGEVQSGTVRPSSAEPRARGTIVDADALFAPLSRTTAPRPSSFRWSFAGIWLAGFVVFVLRLLSGHLSVARIARRATERAEADWVADAAEAACVLGLHRPVRLRRTHAIGVPAVGGWLRPTVLLPPESDSWSQAQRRVVLLHELAHVRRGDCFIQPLAAFAAAVHWFNPLVHLANLRLRVEQERACDDHVLHAGVSATDYAQHLCEIVQGSRRTGFPLWAALGLNPRARLEQRIKALLDRKRRRGVPSRRLRLAVLAGGVIGALVLGTIRTTATASDSRVIGTDNGLATSPAVLVSTTYPSLPVAQQIRTLRTLRARDAFSAGAQPDIVSSYVTEYCVRCHNAKLRTANVVLDGADVDRIADNAVLWEKIVRRLRSGTHPPSGQPRPEPVVTDAVIAAVESELDRNSAAAWAPNVAGDLTSVELADRLAQFLWGTAPDEELQQVAAGGRLVNSEVLRQQVDRMLADSRANAFLTGFFGRWLYLTNMDKVRPDATAFPEFDDSLRAAFRRETELFVEAQVREDRPVTELLTANYTFVNERLAAHYGIPNISGPEFRRITLRNDTRAGILGQGSVLTVTSYADRTSPVLRGKFVLEMLFGAPPPPPPPNVPALRANDPAQPTTLRTRLESAVKSPVCASCHSAMDPVGFGLENFDAVGRWRETESGLPIDPSGKFAEMPFRGPVEFRIALMQRSDAFVRTVTLRLLAYALDRPTEYFDMPAVRAVVDDAAVANHRWSSLIRGVVLSMPFRMKRLTAP